MNTDSKPVMRCAIYTRKSSEEGLEQSFNSLDAQREAGEAFILSQRHEGWRMLPARYDDGGYSGGTMERPALKRLLEDVQAKKVNVVVVYKVDRLTRSLSDFAKIVEALDAKGVSFVSVTQQFNTTTSMGRLTLNILLSFAQFEREVTGERIRDKIAASKKKGMWMGGTVPLRIRPRSTQANSASHRSRTGPQHFCSLPQTRLRAEADGSTQSRERQDEDLGDEEGDAAWRCLLCSWPPLLPSTQSSLRRRNSPPRHAGIPGAHPGIVPRELWDKVQAQLDSNLRTQRNRAREQSSSLLTGLIEDGEGNRFTPSFTIKRGRRYRYYVSKAVIQNPASQQSGPTRLPAHELESRVTERLQAFLKSDAQVFDELSATVESPAVLHQLVAGAKKLAVRLTSLPADDLRDLLACILQRVTVQENNIQVMIRKSDLRELLEHGDIRRQSGGLAKANRARRAALFDHRSEAEAVRWRNSPRGSS